MPIVKWGEEYLLGIEEFDEHHEHLVNLLNKSYDEYEHDPAAGNIVGIINELIEYTCYHFDAEESWMSEIAYPGLTSQKEEHATFKDKIFSFQNDLAEGRATHAQYLCFLQNGLLSTF